MDRGDQRGEPLGVLPVVAAGVGEHVERVAFDVLADERRAAELLTGEIGVQRLGDRYGPVTVDCLQHVPFSGTVRVEDRLPRRRVGAQHEAPPAVTDVGKNRDIARL